ncbi:hypothetical protein E2C01_080524 [Portunus trituberculatus]|uniref:Uncharacterized protein n=1 Tax=Portunus trituberculatus TaxID=210409 RepID=A0A5B7IVN0_PORTR|nr:hypothetical protein [Portunus trituberculatus]
MHSQSLRGQSWTFATHGDTQDGTKRLSWITGEDLYCDGAPEFIFIVTECHEPSPLIPRIRCRRRVLLNTQRYYRESSPCPFSV